jgi:putative mRNA 3-end processing factor
MPVELRKGGMVLSGTPLWFDARRKSELSFVSHAHTDHIARHERVIATAATVRLMEHRLGPIAAPLPVPYRRGFELGKLWIELFPAGHVLGSAQIRVTREDGKRIVYTGDLSLDKGLTSEHAELLECDTLVLESTFGHPRFKFPSRQAAFDQVEHWAREKLGKGIHPIIYAYSLGKGQEAIKQLVTRGMKVCAHPKVFEVSQLYTELGMPIEVRRFDGTLEDDEVGVFPPFGKSPALKQIHPRATAVLTGWALESWGARRYAADVAFPVSDHADYESLLKYAQASQATEVVTHHGLAEELAQRLRKEGMFARAATQAVQMEMFPRPPEAIEAELAKRSRRRTA